MKTSYTKPKTLLTRFLLLTAIVILLILYSQYSVSHSLKDLKKDEQLVDAASEQQRTTLLITQQMTADQLQGIEMTLPLDSLTTQIKFVQNHTLASGDQTNPDYTTAYQNLSKAFTGFNEALATSLNNDAIVSYVNLLGKQRIYLVELEKFTVAVGENSNTKINRFRRVQVLIVWATIVILSLSAIFIFLPVVKKVEHQNERLKQIAYNQSHVVRRPLANIKLFLNLIQIAPDEDKRELLDYIKTEAEELDNIICSSVKQTELLV